MLIGGIVEDKGSLWNDGSSFWLLIEVIINAIGYRLLMVTSDIGLAYLQGLSFERLVGFWGF